MSHYSPHAAPYSAGPGRHSGAPPARDRVTVPLLVASVLCTGLMAGLFFAYDISVMPGLAELDDAAYATAMQRFNAVIDGSALFGLVFLAALGLTVAAAIVAFRRKRRAVALPLTVAAVCYLLALVLTVAVSLPLNADLAALGDPASAQDLHAVIDDFKSVWVPVNVFRTLLCVLSLGALCAALLRYEKTDSPVELRQ
ncbi:DUF1772 domain-containing protein [Streptomyces sp. NPDC020755]|uniref:anthrone oxygenase family protein n=1 Tax=Streptomyces sp. NPDC020755 TaxID=3154790 RepID=UPI0033D14111